MECEAESRQPVQSRVRTIRPFTEEVCQSLRSHEPNLQVPGPPQVIFWIFISPASGPLHFMFIAYPQLLEFLF